MLTRLVGPGWRDGSSPPELADQRVTADTICPGWIASSAASYGTPLWGLLIPRQSSPAPDLNRPGADGTSHHYLGSLASG